MALENRLREWIAATRFGRVAGIELSPVTHVERLISMTGGFAAILLLILTEQRLLGETGAAMLIGSMGATAVLLFAIPHGALSQPWAVLVGNASSAAVGVTCCRFISDPMLAAALAVGIAIGLMHYLRAIHPPGGATALTAVIGGPQVHDLGYGFVFTPVLINSAVMVLAAVAINAAFAWRRYPAALAQATSKPRATSNEDLVSHADFVASLRRIGTFVDISEDEFLMLRKLMREEEASRSRLKPQDLRVGRYYSNGASGQDFCVRCIDEEERAGDRGLKWTVVAGQDRDAVGSCSREEFSNWAFCEVQRAETTWIRKAA